MISSVSPVLNTSEADSKNKLFNNLSRLQHEQLMFCSDNETGLKAIIGIHNTVLGPALGGTRVWKYKNEEDAIYDVMRLSRGMTYKSSISGINLGGGKAVILIDDNTVLNEAFWRRYGKFVNNLNGKYITAEDVGTSTKEIEYVAMETKHVAGKPAYMGGTGDPSPVTAYGVYLGMKAAAQKMYGSDSLHYKTICVQGVGHVGQYLLEHLTKEGAKVKVCDINQNNLKQTTDRFNVEVINPEDVYTTDMDIYAPCALGATLNDESIPQLKCAIVAGAANNQLKDELENGRQLVDRGILYAPDFLINAGGVINCYAEVIGITSNEVSKTLTNNIYDKTLAIFDRAASSNITPQEAAMQLAEERIQSVAAFKSRI